MEFIIANEKGEEVTLLTDKQYIDIEIGEGNTFSIQISKKYQKKWGIDSGWWIGCPGKEYGGIIDGVKSVNETIVLSGKTWRGLLEKKIIEPPSGQDYRFVSGDANTIINNIVCSEFDDIFVCDEQSGISLNNFQFDRYVTYLAGIEKMLLSKNAKLEIKYNSGEANRNAFVEIRAVPIIDYSEQIEYSKDGTLYYIYFSFEKFTGGINHLICLGKGELKDRLVLHLYADENGNIGTEQHFFGADEREATYDYSSAGTEEDLRKNGTEKFKELLSYKSMDMDLFNESLAGLRGINDDISIGDIVGGRDFDTGIYLSKQITRKIVQVKNGRESIEYGVGKPVLNRNSANAPVEQSDPLDKLIKVTSDGTGLAVGKDAELSNVFDVGLDTIVRGSITGDNIKLPSGVSLQTLYDEKINASSADVSSYTLAQFVEWISNMPYMCVIGRLKLANAFSPYGTSNWFRVIAIGQNKPYGTYGVGIQLLAMNDSDTYIGSISGTDAFTITWKKINTDSSTDYVVAQGVSNEWYYRKWASGRAECYKNYLLTPSWASVGNVYYQYTPSIPLPFTFVEMLSYSASIMDSDYLTFASADSSGGNLTKVSAVVFQMYNSSTNKVLLSLQCYGRWK